MTVGDQDARLAPDPPGDAVRPDHEPGPDSDDAGQTRDHAADHAGQARDHAADHAGQARDRAADHAGQARDHAADDAGQAHDRAADDAGQARDRAAELEQRFSLPVIVAAVASVPAVFLSMMDGTAQLVGNVVNYVTLAVFGAEFLTLVWAAEDKRRWVREHKFVILVLLAAIPAVVLFVGAVQALRLGHLVTRFLSGVTHFLSGATHAAAGATRFVTGLKIARLRQLFRAFRKLRERTGLRGWRWSAVQGAFAALGLAALAMVLADPESATRQFLDDLVGAHGVAVLVGLGLAVAALAAVGFAVSRRRGDRVEA